MFDEREREKLWWQSQLKEWLKLQEEKEQRMVQVRVGEKQKWINKSKKYARERKESSAKIY